MKNRIVFIVLVVVLSFFSSKKLVYGQDVSSEINLLKVDTSYAFFQYHSLATAKRFADLFANAKNKRVVLFHFGASHIQAEIVTTRAKEYLYEKFGNAGPGFFFPFSAAKTYGSINYKSTHTGEWASAKSYQVQPKIPLGARGMTVETRAKVAGFTLTMNTPIPKEEYELLIFFDNNDLTPDFKITAGDFEFTVDESVKSSQEGKNFLVIPINQEIQELSLNLLPTEKAEQLFRFYGFSLEKKNRSGLLYQSFGVGASPFEAVLNLEKLKEQSEQLQPDLVILDYGTNNILYQNKVPSNLPANVVKAITQFREINPNILIALTSTQDLFYRGKYIDAGIDFAKMMDTIAKENDVMYWNFYDLSGGYGQIKNWESQGYAQKDYVHLTSKGYRLKGYLLNKSILNTLDFYAANSELDSLTIPLKNYDAVKEQTKVVAQSTSSGTGGRSTTHKVRKGDTLSEIAAKYGVRVSTLKRLNNLRSDLIRIGQVLKIR
jgi:lysophospholipase L1-like esterase